MTGKNTVHSYYCNSLLSYLIPKTTLHAVAKERFLNNSIYVYNIDVHVVIVLYRWPVTFTCYPLSHRAISRAVLVLGMVGNWKPTLENSCNHNYR